MPERLKWLVSTFVYTMELFSLWRLDTNLSLRLGLVKVLPCHWPSSEVSWLLWGHVASISILTVIVRIRLLDLLTSTSCICSWERLALNLLDHVRIFMDHIKLWLGNIIIEVNRLVRFHVIWVKILLRFSSWWEKRFKDSIRASWVDISLSIPRDWLFIHGWELIASKLINIHCIYILVGWLLLWGTICLSLLIKSHNWCWFMLLPHHFDCLLSAVKVKPIILLLLLDLSRNTIKPIIFIAWLFVSHSWLGLAYPWEVEVFLGRQIPFSTSLSLCFLLCLSHTVLHQYQVSVLVGTLLSLSLLNPAVEEVHSLFILLF